MCYIFVIDVPHRLLDEEFTFYLTLEAWFH